MAEIKSLDKISKLWSKRASAAGDEYKDGVENPRKDWEANTAGADEARKQGLADADDRDAFVKGVRKTGNAGWKKGAVEKGVKRYPGGVRTAEPKFRSGFAKYHSVIQGITLPPRGPKGSPENIERVAIIARELHSAKVEG